jgi:glycosyltransferase involved in cell wall biosynthesis
MKIEFDISPIFLNKTAIYRIVWDTIKTYPADKATFSFLGCRLPFERLPKIRLGWVLLRLLKRPKVFLLFLSMIAVIRHVLGHSERKTIYFDPLYIFSKLKIDSDIVWVLDLSPLTIPGFHSSGVRYLYKKAFEKIQMSNCRIVSISESTKNDLIVNLGISVERIHCINLYVINRPQSVTTAVPHLVGQNFLLFVGSLEYRKNLEFLLSAFASSSLPSNGYRLVIVGGDGFGSEAIKGLASRIPLVDIMGYLSDSALAWLYQNAVAFVYPSLWEGFGIPVIEAMNRGSLCLTSTTGACPEVGGDAALYCDPCDLQSIVTGFEKLTELDTHAKAALRQKAIDRSKTFSFDNYMNRLIKLIED